MSRKGQDGKVSCFELQNKNVELSFFRAPSFSNGNVVGRCPPAQKGGIRVNDQIKRWRK